MKKISYGADKHERCIQHLGYWLSNLKAAKIDDKKRCLYHSLSANQINNLTANVENGSALLIDDAGCQLVDVLYKKGITDITMTFSYGKNNPKIHDHLVSTIKGMFLRDYPTLKFLPMEETNLTDFDYIIANPPYEIGNEITKFIVKNVNFKKYINLMPISKYKANKLYQHINPDSIVHSECTTDFSGAFTTPICSEIVKTRTNDYNYDEFEVKFLYDTRLSKFWRVQLMRENTFLNHMCMVYQKDFNKISSKTSFSCGIYTPSIMLSNGPKTLKNSDGSFKTEDRHYVWNFLKPDDTIDNYFKPTSSGVIGQTVTIFKTEQEADNFKNWAHSGELSGKGRLQGLFSILLRAMNKPTDCPFPYAIPKVDWTRAWTDEEILRDYGYTEEEIAEILHFNDDLIKENSTEETADIEA